MMRFFRITEINRFLIFYKVILLFFLQNETMEDLEPVDHDTTTNGIDETVLEVKESNDEKVIIENEETANVDKECEIIEENDEVEVKEEKLTTLTTPDLEQDQSDPKEAPLASMEHDPAPLASLDSAASSELPSM